MDKLLETVEDYLALRAKYPKKVKQLFEPCATVQEVEACEKLYGIELPENYRRTVLEIGNGSKPIGWSPMGSWHLTRRKLAPWSESNGYLGDLKKDFPHQSDWQPLKKSDNYKADAKKIDYHSQEQIAGTIPIILQDGKCRDLLVVTGPMAGMCWFDQRNDHRGITRRLEVDHDLLETGKPNPNRAHLSFDQYLANQIDIQLVFARMAEG